MRLYVYKYKFNVDYIFDDLSDQFLYKIGEDNILSKIYRLNSNSTRNINLKFTFKGGSKHKIIQLLHLYEENSGKMLVFKNIPINWK